MTDANRNVERSAKIDTEKLSDALDRLGIAGQCLGVKPLHHGFRLTGRAFTLTYGPATNEGTVGDYIDDVPVGAVIVIDNQGREDASVWGDILTMCAHQRGVNGTVIEGACRDTHLAMELNYEIFSRSYSMRTGKDRVQLDRVGGIVEIGGARILPGDIIRGDSDGVLSVPQGSEGRVLDLAEAINQAEGEIRKSVSNGARLDEARRQYSYHLLQRREKR